MVRAGGELSCPAESTPFVRTMEQGRGEGYQGKAVFSSGDDLICTGAVGGVTIRGVGLNKLLLVCTVLCSPAGGLALLAPGFVVG